MMYMKKPRSGFTIVELLIVIVVIAILAAISIVAYNGIQERARFAKIQSELNSYVKGLSSIVIKDGAYPVSGGSCMDGTITCWPGITQSNSTALNNKLKEHLNVTPVLSTSTVFTYGTTANIATGVNYTGYYIAFNQVSSKDCIDVGGATLLNSTVSGDTRTCRLAVSNP